MTEYVEFEVRQHNYLVFGESIVGDTLRNLMPPMYEMHHEKDWQSCDSPDMKGKIFHFPIQRVEHNGQYLFWRL